MRLIAIRLENFLAYHAPAELWLDTVELAVLSGSNGAGKSSLLDAVTWALWGRARTPDDDALIHSGQQHMTVNVQFDQDGVRYEVTRKHTRGKPNTLSLFRYVEGQPEVLGNRLRETQATIDQLLKLNYDTFVNSAFLRQGDADLFTTSKPAERKQVLGRILDLDRWSRFESAAKSRAKEIDTQLTSLQDTIDRLSGELTRSADVPQKLAASQMAFEQAQIAREAAEHAYHAARGAEAEATGKLGQINDLVGQVDRNQRMWNTLAQRYQKLTEQITRASDLIARQTEIDSGWAALVEARTQEADFRSAQIQHAQAEGDLKTAYARLEAELSAVDRDVGRLTRQFEDAQKAIQNVPQFQSQLAALEEVRHEREGHSRHLAELKNESTALTERNRALRVQMDTIKERLAMLQSAVGEAECPVCGQPLDQAHRDGVAEGYTREGKTFGDEFRANKQRIDSLAREVPTVEAALATCDNQLLREKSLAAELGKIDEKQRLIDEKQAERRDRNTERDALRQQLAVGDYGHAERARIESIGYDPVLHEQLRTRIAELTRFETDQRALTLALEALPDLEREQLATDQQGADLQSQITAAQTRIDALKAEIAVLVDRVEQEKQAKSGWDTAKRAEWSAQEKLIGLQQQVITLETVRLHLEEAREMFTVQGEEIAAYRILAEAFGKNGVPALIIDSAIPEIEQEANQLLGRLTDHRLHLRLDTQKVNKSGDVADTLNLQVSDERETRDYALYSGGEGFRIDFAVRMALSTLLARRAGAQLQTLFIDEGFGSQDSSGRERLLEAINAIRSQFDLILVVTHIDEMRDAFPVHIRITKQADGSIIELIQNG